MDPGARWSIGRYTVLKRLSVGGMAEVFLARASGPGEFRKFVTIKRILPDLQEDEDFVRMFLEEARISAVLSHANIAQVFDLCADDQDLFLAMEYVAGEDLNRILKAAKRHNVELPVGFVAMLCRDAANALHYAHTFVDTSGERTPVIHRDVSPKNVMVTYSGSVKVIDFGIAKIKYESQLSGTTSVKGSTGYMSPEQIRGIGTDARSDIFSLGVVLYEALTGIKAFSAGRVIDIPDPTRLKQPHLVRGDIPEALSNVAFTAMALDPARRFESAKDMARAIEAATADIFDEERAAALMQSFFKTGIETIRMLLRSAGAPTIELQEALARLGPEARHTSSHIAVSAPAVDEPRTEQVTLRDAPRPHILAVDDSFASLQVLKGQLARAGFQVTTASNATEAFAALAEATPDLIILDVMMPGVTGFEICRQLREREQFRNTPILFLSGACSLEERIRGLEVGGDDFIRKPYAAAELALRVRSHLARVAVLHQRS